MKRVVIIFTLVFFAFTTRFVMGGEEIDIKTIEEYRKAMRAKPDIVSTDSIFVGYSLDKLYYQNIKIIQLLDNINNRLQELPDNFNKTFSNQNSEIIQLLKEMRSLLREPSVKLQENTEPKTE